MSRFDDLKLSLIIGAGILALVALAYGPSLGYPYVQDAVPAVKLNPIVERGDLGEIFGSDYWAETVSSARTLYRPVTVLSFALERRLEGGGRADARVSHAVNAGLHALAAFLLFSYVRRFGDRRVAGPAALLFAAHPLALQSVANVVGRADLLATVGALGALLALAGTGAGAPWKRRAGAWGAGALAFVALGAKEVAVALPLLLVAQEWVLRGERRAAGRAGWIERAAVLAPTALAVCCYLALRTAAIEAFPGLQPLTPHDNVLVGMEGASRWATAWAMAARYVGLMAWPVGLSVGYSGGVIPPEPGLGAPLALAGCGWLALVVLCALAPLRIGGDRARVVAMGAWLWLLPYLAVGNLIVLNAAGFAERLVYLPLAGFTVLAAALLVTAASAAGAWSSPVRGRVVAGIALVALFGLALQTRREARMWQSLEALYEHALAARPGALLASFGLAELRREQGRHDEALELFERGLAVSPTSGELWEGQGRLLREMGRLDQAEPSLRRAIEAYPGLPRAHAQLGIVLNATGRFEEAERALLRALRLNPRLDRAAEELGYLYMRTGRYTLAAHYFRGCVRLGRTDLLPALRQAEQRQ